MLQVAKSVQGTLVHPFPDSAIVDILPHLPCQSLSLFLFIHAYIFFPKPRLVGDILPLQQTCCRV